MLIRIFRVYILLLLNVNERGKVATVDLCLMMTQLQMENGILLPTLQSALPFLDLHGTPRLEFHQSVFDELRENLMERVAVIAEGKEADRYVFDLIYETSFFLWQKQFCC